MHHGSGHPGTWCGVGEEKRVYRMHLPAKLLRDGHPRQIRLQYAASATKMSSSPHRVGSPLQPERPPCEGWTKAPPLSSLSALRVVSVVNSDGSMARRWVWGGGGGGYDLVASVSSERATQEEICSKSLLERYFR
jgi:hypothetical protein